MKPWKVQKFFGDVLYDLRSRGLLPVAILLVIAMVAVPMLVSRGSSGSESSSPQPAAAPANTAPETKKAVVSYDPGVRDYRERLDELSPQNPFRQQFAQSAAAASQLESSATTPNTATGSAGSTTSSSSTTSSAPASGGGTPTVTHDFTLYHASADISFGDLTQPLQRHKSLKTYASLPNELAPVLIYVGSTLDRKKALFAVSKIATPVGGEGTCAPDPPTCSLLALAPGHYEDLLYADDGKTYRVKVNNITLTRRVLNP